MNINLLKKLEGLIADVESHVEGKSELIKCIVLALLTRKNVFILGDPGNAKSYVIDLIRKRIAGSKQFKTLVTKQKDEEQLFGRLDITSLFPNDKEAETAFDQYLESKYAEFRNMKILLRKTSQALINELNRPTPNKSVIDKESLNKENIEKEINKFRDAARQIEEFNDGPKASPKIITKNKIPDAHLVYTDEVFNGNDGVLNSMMTAMNEREYTNEGVTLKLPVHCFFGSSNQIPDFNNPDERVLRAFYDRFEIRVVSSYLDKKEEVMSAFKKARYKNSSLNGTITLDELEDMQKEVSSVNIPDAIDELMFEIASELRKNIDISDRKLLNYYPLAQAAAWLNGRDTVQPDDLMVLRNYFWNKPTEITGIEEILVKYTTNPMREKINALLPLVIDTFDQTMNFDINTNAVNKAKQFSKFKKEFLKIFDMLSELSQKASVDKDKVEVNNMISDMEEKSKKVHEKYGFTYVPLIELKALSI